MNKSDLEDSLMIFSWGQWARPRIDQTMGYKPQGWVAEMSKGFRESPKNPIPPIRDEYAESLDNMIASLPPETVELLIALYCYRMGVNWIARETEWTRHEIRETRDAALNQLYGALTLRAAG